MVTKKFNEPQQGSPAWQILPPQVVSAAAVYVLQAGDDGFSDVALVLPIVLVPTNQVNPQPENEDDFVELVALDLLWCVLNVSGFG
jgi:hypothetical protein